MRALLRTIAAAGCAALWAGLRYRREVWVFRTLAVAAVLMLVTVALAGGSR